MKLSVLLLHLLVSSLVRISYQCSLSSIAKGRCPPDGSDPTVCTLRPDDDAYPCPYKLTSIVLTYLGIAPSRRPTTEPTLSPSRYPSKGTYLNDTGADTTYYILY